VHVKPFGFDGYLTVLVLHLLVQPLLVVIIKAQLSLLKILSSMTNPSTLKGLAFGA
jgi:hypothetical protein